MDKTRSCLTKLWWNVFSFWIRNSFNRKFANCFNLVKVVVLVIRNRLWTTSNSNRTKTIW